MSKLKRVTLEELRHAHSTPYNVTFTVGTGGEVLHGRITNIFFGTLRHSDGSTFEGVTGVGVMYDDGVGSIYHVFDSQEFRESVMMYWD